VEAVTADTMQTVFAIDAQPPDFPVRCTWAPVSHDQPAVAALLLARPCGHRDKLADALSCAEHFEEKLDHPVGRAHACPSCGAVNSVQVVGIRSLNEGDLPEPGEG
jgi:hypothetical protein